LAQDRGEMTVSMDEGKKTRKVRSRDIQVLRYFERFATLLTRLYTVGTAFDPSDVRHLPADPSCLLILI